MPLIVKCKSYGFEHPSVYQMDRESFEDPSVTMTNYNEDCGIYYDSIEFWVKF
jgi:hypothetical protein